MLKSNLHSLHDAILLSPDGNAIMLITDCTTYSVFELPSLKVRGRLIPPSAKSSRLEHTWQAWTCQGSSVAILWTTSETNSNQVAVYTSSTCRLLRLKDIPISTPMALHKYYNPGAVLAACSDKMAVSLLYNNDLQSVLQVVILDLSTDAALVSHYIEINHGFYPSGLSLCPSGEFLAVTMEATTCTFPSTR